MSEWHENPKAPEILRGLSAEVTTILEYGDEADLDLSQEPMAFVDLDNVGIALSSVHAAAERALEQLKELYGEGVGGHGGGT